MTRSQAKSLPSQPDGSISGQASFAGLFERYKNLVYKTAYLMLDSADEAEEALQEVFVLVYRSLPGYDPARGALSTWLHRITINYCLGHKRKRRVLCEPLDDESIATAGEGADADFARLAEREAVRRAINRLSDKLRVVVILRYYWELPYAEIAEVLEIPLGTVKSRLDLALRTLRGLCAQPDGSEAGLWSQSPATEGEAGT